VHRVKEATMLSPSLALEQFTYASRAPQRSPVRQYRPIAACPVLHDEAFHELVAEIRAHEGQEVPSPMLFSVTVAVGVAMTTFGMAVAAVQLF
jgi:hypothetical protein